MFWATLSVHPLVGDATSEVGFESGIGAGGVDVVDAADEVGFPDA